MRTSAVAWLALLALSAPAVARADEPAPVPAALLGVWAGKVTHDGESQPIGLELGPGSPGHVTLTYDFPVAHFEHVAFGEVEVTPSGDSVRIGPFRFAFDSTARVLRGNLPHLLAPVYDLAVTLKRAERFEFPTRPPLGGTDAVPAWTYDAGSPLWAGPTYAAGLVYVGGLDGVMHALDAKSGARRWTYRAGGAIRSRPTIAGRDLYVLADDNVLYRLDAASGALRWRTAVADSPVTRLPAGQPGALFDRFGSDVTIAGQRLVVGTHGGDVVALDVATGRILWTFHAGGAVLAAPAVREARVYAGSINGFVFALDAARGTLQWKRDTRGAVVSTPTLAGSFLVVGNRAYDLLGLDAGTGAMAWKRYIWGSWVESSATVLGDVAYVGSSDAAVVSAYDASSGRRLWSADVHGWTWGQPAVTERSVYAGVSGLVGYPVPLVGGVVAIDRATGAVRWRLLATAPAAGAFGFPGSVAVGDGRVYAGGLDGRVVALPQ